MSSACPYLFSVGLDNPTMTGFRQLRRGFTNAPMKRASRADIRDRRQMKKIYKIALLALLPITFLVSLLAWAYASPVGASPDDDYHLASIWCGGGTDNLCMESDSKGHMLVPASAIESSDCYRFNPGLSGGCVGEQIEEFVDSDRGNFKGDYPPFFYATLSIFSGDNLFSSVVLMRAFNGILFIALMTCAAVLLPVSRKKTLLWAVFASIVPLGMFIIPSVNPSSWAITSSAVLWISLVGFFETKKRWRMVALALLASLAAFIGAGSRGDAALYTILGAGVACILMFEWRKEFFIRATLPIAISIFAGSMFLTSGHSSAADPSVMKAENVFNHTFQVLVHLPELWAGALGVDGLGWLDTKLPGTTWVAVMVVFGSLSFWGLRQLDMRKVLAVTGIALSLIAIPAYIMVKDGVLIGQGVQARYIYPLMIIFLGVCLFRVRQGSFWPNSFQLSIAALAISVANAVALHVNMRRYLTGITNGSANLNNSIEWWWPTSIMPFAPMTVWMIGSIAFALGAGALVWLSWCMKQADRTGVAGSGRSVWSDGDRSAIEVNQRADGRRGAE